MVAGILGPLSIAYALLLWAKGMLIPALATFLVGANLIQGAPKNLIQGTPNPNNEPFTIQQAGQMITTFVFMLWLIHLESTHDWIDDIFKRIAALEWQPITVIAVYTILQIITNIRRVRSLSDRKIYDLINEA